MRTYSEQFRVSNSTGQSVAVAVAFANVQPYWIWKTVNLKSNEKKFIVISDDYQIVASCKANSGTFTTNLSTNTKHEIFIMFQENKLQIIEQTTQNWIGRIGIKNQTDREVQVRIVLDGAEITPPTVIAPGEMKRTEVPLLYYVAVVKEPITDAEHVVNSQLLTEFTLVCDNQEVTIGTNNYNRYYVSVK